jgi:uncharacterized damage-inducible protein DinB
MSKDRGWPSPLSPRITLLLRAGLDRAPDGSKCTFGDLIQGVAFHDIYHAGQIQILKRRQGISRGTGEGAG